MLDIQNIGRRKRLYMNWCQRLGAEGLPIYIQATKTHLNLSFTWLRIYSTTTIIIRIYNNIYYNINYQFVFEYYYSMVKYKKKLMHESDHIEFAHLRHFHVDCVVKIGEDMVDQQLGEILTSRSQEKEKRVRGEKKSQLLLSQSFFFFFSYDN